MGGGETGMQPPQQTGVASNPFGGQPQIAPPQRGGGTSLSAITAQPPQVGGGTGLGGGGMGLTNPFGNLINQRFAR